MNISEIFYSIQGEGGQLGMPTVFIRTAGCNLRCEWCDTKYAWEDGCEMSVEEVMDEISEYPMRRVCITGGEPMLQKETFELIDTFDEWTDILVESNGSVDITPLIERDVTVSMDYKTPSSGMSQRMEDHNLHMLRMKDQLKFVIADMEDFDFARDMIEGYEPEAEVIFQPEGNSDIKQIAERVLEEQLDIRVLPQLHKLVWGDERGR